MSKICSKCNSTLKENQKFCIQCGTKYEELCKEEQEERKNFFSQSKKNRFKEIMNSKKVFVIEIFISIVILYWLVAKYNYHEFNANALPVNKTYDINSKEIISVINTAKNRIEIDQLGRIAQVTMIEEKYKNFFNEQVKLLSLSQLRPLEVRFEDSEINYKAFGTRATSSKDVIDASVSPQKLIIFQNLQETILTKEFIFYPSGYYDLTVKSTNNKNFFITNGDMRTYSYEKVLIKDNNSLISVFEDGFVNNVVNVDNIKILSSFDRFFATSIFDFNKSLPRTTIMRDSYYNPMAFIHGGDSISFSGYIGARDYDSLKEINHEMTDIIDYGWATFILKPIIKILSRNNN